MMSGILVALVFPMVIMPMLGVDKARWIGVMSILAIISLPLVLLEYYVARVLYGSSIGSKLLRE